MGCNKKKKAFTLTELLVVVIVLGVLAGVAAPKFKRVLETRKTTEAENMLAAVRTEQEKRCIMGKNYRGLGEESKLETLANAATSANYSYSLTNAGVSATSKGASKRYQIKMLSYKNGTLCCEDVENSGGCAALNKNYPICEEKEIEDECAAMTEGSHSEELKPGDIIVEEEDGCVKKYEYIGMTPVEYFADVGCTIGGETIKRLLETSCPCETKNEKHSFSVGSTYNEGRCMVESSYESCFMYSDIAPWGLPQEHYEKKEGSETIIKDCACESPNQEYSELFGECICNNDPQPELQGLCCDTNGRTGRINKRFTFPGCDVKVSCGLFRWEQQGLSVKCPENYTTEYLSGPCDPSVNSEIVYGGGSEGGDCFRYKCKFGGYGEVAHIGACEGATQETIERYSNLEFTPEILWNVYYNFY